MSRSGFPVLGVIGAGLLILSLITLIVLAACTPDESAPVQPTGIEVDIDRAKPRDPDKAPKPVPAPKQQAPKPRSK